jgi:hypothetical protein
MFFIWIGNGQPRRSFTIVCCIDSRLQGHQDGFILKGSILRLAVEAFGSFILQYLEIRRIPQANRGTHVTTNSGSSCHEQESL